MIPNLYKIRWYLGTSSLALLMEQDRRHWLLKTDKTKHIQDPSGDEFQGSIDNLGSDVIVETQKLPYIDTVLKKAKFTSENISDVLDLQASVFPNIPELPGLKFARLKSINLLQNNTYHNFRLVLKNCSIVYVPIASGTDSGDVLVYKWYRTTTAPSLQIMENNQYTAEIPVEFSAGVTNGVYYYPVDSVIQPFGLNASSTDTTCLTNLITDDNDIGYPLFWFQCNESQIGPIVRLGNNDTQSTNPISKLLTIGHAGNESDYVAYLYPATGSSSYVSPDGAAGNWFICCDSADTPFTGTSADFLLPITNIRFVDGANVNTITTNNSVGNNVYYMAQHEDWVYDSTNNCYKIPVASFVTNVYEDHNVLEAVFRIALDESLSFEDRTTDVGYAGMQMTAAQTSGDQSPTYPHDIDQFDGLPQHITDHDPDTCAQQLSVYAIHNTPYYTPSDPTSRQIAGLILDPGVEKTSSSDTPFENDEIGRVYVLSNDDTSYVNNATASNPKPARTIARICDIPTSVMQLSNISGLAPTSVVDKKYVRSLVSYTEDDKDRLYNGLRSLWVKPTDLDAEGVMITQRPDQTNDFVFDKYEYLELVDLINHNDYRTLSNLNPMVDPANVSVAAISEPGSGYTVNDCAIIVVGGFSFTVSVLAVNDDGGATSVSISPNENLPINLANFDLYDEYSGLTLPYGSSPLGNTTGTGLKIQFRINNFDSLLPQKGDVVDGLFAFAKDTDGIWLCTYSNDIGNTHAWMKQERIAEANNSNTAAIRGSVSAVDAYMDSIIPSVRPITVSTLEPKQAEITIYGFNTASSMNIVDQNASPVLIPPSSHYIDQRTVIDINKYYSRGFTTLTAKSKNISGVITAIKEAHLDAYDSYVVWRWVSESSTNRMFECAVIRRSLDNLRSTDSTSSLPDNDLVIKRFVHTNPQTTVVWNVDKVGPMVWMYNPNSTTHETYYIDATTRELCVKREPITWDNLDVTDISRTTVEIVRNGVLRYNILTNNPALCGMPNQAGVIYQQPDYQQLPNCTIGSVPDIVPTGAWELVFPQVHSFSFRNEDNTVSHNPTRMHVVRGDNMNPNLIIDENGDVANSKTLLMSQNTDTNRIELKAYNDNTGAWDIL